jgi:hypothetical protein
MRDYVLHEAQGYMLFVQEYAGQPNIHLTIAPSAGRQNRKRPK